MKSVYQNQAREAIREGDLATAAAAFDELARMDPDDIEICLMAANMAEKAGMVDQAAEWYAYVAHCYVNQKDLPRAVVMMKHYQHLKPTERKFCRQLFRCCRHMDEQTQCFPLLHVEDRVCMSFRKHELFSILSDQAFDDLLPHIEVETYQDGAVIARSGDTAAKLYLIAEGAIRPCVDIDGDMRKLAVIRAPGICGEVPFLTGGNERTADLFAVGETTLACIPYTVLHDLTQKYPRVRKQLDEYYCNHVLERQLAQSALFMVLNEEERRQAITGMTSVHLSAGEVLYSQGEAENLGLYVVRSGWLSVNVTLAGQSHLLFTAKTNDVLGEIALLEGQRRFTVRAVSDVVLMCWPEDSYRQSYEQRAAMRHYVADRLLMYQQAMHDIQAGKIPEIREYNIGPQRLLQQIYGE